MKNKTPEQTDWTAYYSKPKSKFSSATQKITQNLLTYYIKKYTDKSLNIIELGGGNSCFAHGLMDHIDISNYSIIDNCEVAVEMFKKMHLPGNAYVADLKAEHAVDNIPDVFNVVFSVGLIEHFNTQEIIQIIGTHFKLCEPGGIVVISVPTPTLQYCLVRRFMEVLRVWRFHDEKPLKEVELRPVIERYGKILETKINYRLPLTQLLLVAKKEAGI